MNDTALQALISAFPDPVLLVEAEGFVVAANPAAIDLFGVRIRGAQLRAHLRQPEVSAMLERVFAGSDGESSSFHSHTAQGESIWQVTARHMDGIRIVITLRDISDLEAAGAQRRDFVANVSHELRSPLTVLAGFIETLQGPAGENSETRNEFLGIMAGQAARMTGLVADLLSLSRVESVEKIRPRGMVAIDGVIRATLAALRPQIEAAGLTVTCDLPDLPEIPGDYDQLVQVYHNLIENALKYGASGGRVEITGQRIASMPGYDSAVLRLSIRDYGEGIEPIYLPRLTERFYRVDKARSRDSGGTGLGLAIVKHILGRHRGRLVVQSQPGQGARFDTILPCS